MNIDLDIDITGAEKVGPELIEGFHDGLYESGEHLLKRGREKAERDVSYARRVWNTDVLDGFATEQDELKSRYVDYWSGEIVNEVPHAAVVDKGLYPKGEITGSSPSVQDIMPWVIDHLSPANIEESEIEPDNWHEDAQDMAEEYGPGWVITGFAVREKIDKEGFSGIHFTETTEAYLKRIGPPIVKLKIEKEMRKRLRDI